MTSKNGKGKGNTLEQLAQAKRVPIAFLQDLGLHDLPGGGVGIPYYDVTGEQIAVKRRTALKAKEGSYWPKGKPLAAYGQNRLDRADRAGILILVEGESDCWALWHHGLPALGIPGANALKTLAAEHIEGIGKIYVNREPGQGGEAFIKGSVDRLQVLGFPGQAFELRMPGEIKDPADLHVSDPAEFLKSIEQAIRDSKPLKVSPDLFDSFDDWEKPVPLADTPRAGPFPVEVFPEPLRRFALDTARSVGCPVDYVAIPMLVITGGAVGASRAGEIKKGWTQRPLLYAAVVGCPGDGKSPALNMVAGPIYQAQRGLMDKFQAQMEKYEEDLAAYRQAKKEAKDDPDAQLPAEPEKPHLHRIQVDDTTVEAVGKILEQNSRGVVMIRDELTALVTAANQYKGGKGSDRQFWLKNWTGAPVTIDRKQQDVPLIIPHPFVAVVGGIQPDLLASLRDEKGRADGFLDRFLFGFPELSQMPAWTWEEVPEETIEPWRDCLKELLNLNQEPSEHGLRPQLIRLTADARVEWCQLFNRIVAEQNQEDFPAVLKGPWAKLKVYAARLALIIHLLRWVTRETDESKVDAESVRRAGLLVNYFKSHARKVYAVIGADPEVEGAQRVLQWITRENRKEFKRYEIFNDLRSKSLFPRVEDLEAPLSRLQKHKYIRAKNIPAGNGRGRKATTPTWEVNPLWDRQNNQNNQNNSPQGNSPDFSDCFDDLPEKGDAWEGD